MPHVVLEVQVRIAEPRLTAQLDAMFDSALDPATRCWVLEPDGEWKASPEDGSSVRDHQAQLLAIIAIGADEALDVGIGRLDHFVDVLLRDVHLFGVNQRVQDPLGDIEPLVIPVADHRPQRLLRNDLR